MILAVAGQTTMASAVWPILVCGMGSLSCHRLVFTGSDANAVKVVGPTMLWAASVRIGVTWAPRSTRRRQTSMAL